MLPLLAATAATSLLQSLTDGPAPTPKSASPAGTTSSFADILAAKVGKVANRPI